MPDESKSASRRPLREVLDELHEALGACHDLDEQAREALANTAREIRESLEGEAGPVGEWQSLRQRLTESIASFEKSHPRLTEIVGRVAESLSELGI
jgi:hypothetical protein